MNSAASEPALIGIDWGTSSLRAFLIGADGEVLDKVSSDEGILQIEGGDFEAVFGRLIQTWRVARTLPVIASGMITSRNGWVETPYASAPLTVSDLAQALVSHQTSDGFRLNFVMGVVTRHVAGPDVMRGEETQIVGALANGMTDGCFVLPGTHSKWVRVSDGRIEDYATYMTGELFAALKDHTILGALIEDGPYDPQSFQQGVAAGLEENSNLLHDLFHVRTLPLMGKMAPTAMSDFLSGLLIGAEVKAAKARGDATKSVTLIGRSDLADRYRAALTAAGVPSCNAPENIVAAGHFCIARSAGLVS